jgi:hypothetical protein
LGNFTGKKYYAHNLKNQWFYESQFKAQGVGHKEKLMTENKIKKRTANNLRLYPLQPSHKATARQASGGQRGCGWHATSPADNLHL